MKHLILILAILALAIYGGHSLWQDVTEELTPVVEPVEQQPQPRPRHEPSGRNWMG